MSVAAPTVEAVETAASYDALVAVAVKVAAEPFSRFAELRPVRDAIRRRCWDKAHRDPDLARRLRRMTGPGPAPPASSVEATAKWKMARDFRVAESIAADHAKEQAGR